MYAVTDEYSEAVAAAVRESRIYGQIRTSSGTVYEITNDDIAYGSLSITSRLNKKGDFRAGGVYSSSLSMSLVNFGDVSKDLKGARITLFYDLFREVGGEEYDRIPLGLFWVDGSTIKRRFQTVSLKAADNMLNFDYTVPQISGTLWELVTSACSACGIAISTTQAEFEALPNGTLTVPELNTARVQTWRDLLMYIGMITSSFARISRTGALEIVPLTCSKTSGGVIIPVREIMDDIRSSTDFSDDTERIIRLITRRAGKLISSSITITSEGSEKFTTLEMPENPLLAALTDDEITQVLDSALVPLARCLNRAYKVDFNGDPALDVGDYVRLMGGAIDTARGYATGMITSQTWRYRAGHTIKCELPASVSREDISGAMLLNSASTASTASDMAAVQRTRITPKSQIEKRMDAFEAEGGGTAEKLQTSGSSYYATTSSENGLVISNGDAEIRIKAVGSGFGAGFEITDQYDWCRISMSGGPDYSGGIVMQVGPTNITVSGSNGVTIANPATGDTVTVRDNELHVRLDGGAGQLTLNPNVMRIQAGDGVLSMGTGGLVYNNNTIAT